MSKLAGKEKRVLRALGHHLKPVVQIGHHGITDAVAAAVDAAIADHELVKVKVLESSPIERQQAAIELARICAAELAQVLGRTFLLFRPHPEKPKIELRARAVAQPAEAQRKIPAKLAKKSSARDRTQRTRERTPRKRRHAKA